MNNESGLYIKNERLTKERDVYKHENRNDLCIWWHKKYRHWWLGFCGNIGKNVGHSYLEPDKTCPNEGKSGDWKKSGSDRTINGFISDTGNI